MHVFKSGWREAAGDRTEMRVHSQQKNTLDFLELCLQRSSFADSPLGNWHLNVVAGQERLRGELEQETVFVRVLRLPRRIFLRLLILIGQQEVPARLLLRLCEHKCSKSRAWAQKRGRANAEVLGSL